MYANILNRSSLSLPPPMRFMFLVRFVYVKPIKLIFIKLGDRVLHRPRKTPLYLAADPRIWFLISPTLRDMAFGLGGSLRLTMQYKANTMEKNSQCRKITNGNTFRHKM